MVSSTSFSLRRKRSSALTSADTRAGKEQGFDVVLIDTAGRMQDNEPLMRALAKVRSLSLSLVPVRWLTFPLLLSLARCFVPPCTPTSSTSFPAAGASQQPRQDRLRRRGARRQRSGRPAHQVQPLATGLLWWSGKPSRYRRHDLDQVGADHVDMLESAELTFGPSSSLSSLSGSTPSTTRYAVLSKSFTPLLTASFFSRSAPPSQ